MYYSIIAGHNKLDLKNPMNNKINKFFILIYLTFTNLGFEKEPEAIHDTAVYSLSLALISNILSLLMILTVIAGCEDSINYKYFLVVAVAVCLVVMKSFKYDKIQKVYHSNYNSFNFAYKRNKHLILAYILGSVLAFVGLLVAIKHLFMSE